MSTALEKGISAARWQCDANISLGRGGAYIIAGLLLALMAASRMRKKIV